MSKFKRFMAAFLIPGILSIGLAGCADKTTSTTETKTSTPGGTTSVKTTEEVKKTGDNPPPARP